MARDWRDIPLWRDPVSYLYTAILLLASLIGWLAFLKLGLWILRALGLE